MRIIAELNNATEQERIDFILEYNRKHGYKVTEEVVEITPEEEVQELQGEEEEQEEQVEEPSKEEPQPEPEPQPVPQPQIRYNLKAWDYTDEEKAAQREAKFNEAFFNTSLGYVRRSVKMADGSHKDFLSDLLPVISMGVQSGLPVNILTYDEPPFDQDVTDWTEYQHQVVVTAQFIQECFLQLSADFAPINEEE